MQNAHAGIRASSVVIGINAHGTSWRGRAKAVKSSDAQIGYCIVPFTMKVAKLKQPLRILLRLMYAECSAPRTLTWRLSNALVHNKPVNFHIFQQGGRVSQPAPVSPLVGIR